VDVRELVSFESVQTELGLGPNGALMYCMEHIAANADWLADKLAPLLAADTYLIFDCPGQAELLTSHDALQRLLAAMSDQWHIRCASAMRRGCATRARADATHACPGSRWCTWWTATCARTPASSWRRCCCR
jgi:GTPase SAR1 family protein